MKKGYHVSVKVFDGEPVEKAIKRFTRKVKKSGVIEQYRKTLYYRSPGEARREKQRNARHYLRKINQNRSKDE